jgi:hypothetical protein
LRFRNRNGVAKFMNELLCQRLLDMARQGGKN